jgi:hypothetical protein
VGQRAVVAADRGKALAQSARNPNVVFNVTLLSDNNSRDVDLSVRTKAVAGETDQGVVLSGGPGTPGTPTLPVTIRWRITTGWTRSWVASEP